MRTFPLSILLAFQFASLNAQNWCTPGASWVHGVGFISVYGTITYTYEADTMIGDVLAQRISKQDDVYLAGWPYDTSYTYAHMITSEEDGLVQLWSHYLQAWDTLFWFSAEPGDQWQTAFQSEAGSFVVTDVTFIVEDGVQLRQVHMEVDCDDIYPWTSPLEYTITERMGWCFDLGLYDLCGSAIDGPSGLISYTDNEIEVQATPLHCSQIILGNADPERISIRLFPNPGTDHFKLQLPPSEHNLRILDQLGRSVIEIDRISDQAVIGTTSLPPGIYTVLITDRNGRSSHQRWVKE